MINVIGIGQNRDKRDFGSREGQSQRRSDVIIGYKKYIDQIEKLLIEGKEIVKKGMGDEIVRAEFAIQKVSRGPDRFIN